MRNGSPPALMHNAHDCEYGSQSSARQRKGLPVRTELQQQLFYGKLRECSDAEPPLYNAYP